LSYKIIGLIKKQNRKRREGDRKKDIPRQVNRRGDLYFYLEYINNENNKSNEKLNEVKKTKHFSKMSLGKKSILKHKK